MPVLREISPNRFLIESPLVLNERDGSVLVYVPPGEFEMGDGENGNCPKHPVWLDGYYIGIYAVTNGQYRRFVEATGQPAPGYARWQEPQWTDHPVTDISWLDAQSYAHWAGLSLPTEAQWEKAARGPANRKYPWGDTWDGERCRNLGNFGNETTCPVYGYPRGVSGYGCYNMNGNVWEWCEDWYEEDYYKAGAMQNPRGPATGLLRVKRGGCWGDTASVCRAAYRDGIKPDRRIDDLGFRLAKSS
ncbi:MAG: formylglycine-generating enzyme family protein [Pirellulales bacterium]|nr:formylglycine-generating enzyme family protein [Pirellulales bacterium]